MPRGRLTRCDACNGRVDEPGVTHFEQTCPCRRSIRVVETVTTRQVSRDPRF